VAISLEVLGLPTRVVRTRVGEALERVGLAGRGGDPASVLSGGSTVAQPAPSDPASSSPVSDTGGGA